MKNHSLLNLLLLLLFLGISVDVFGAGVSLGLGGNTDLRNCTSSSVEDKCKFSINQPIGDRLWVYTDRTRPVEYVKIYINYLNDNNIAKKEVMVASGFILQKVCSVKIILTSEILMEKQAVTKIFFLKTM